ncbi:MAG: DUF493 family protein [Luteibaculum sp.]
MTQEQEAKLRDQLDQLHDFPDVYLFKFIIPTDDDKKNLVLSKFSKNAEIKIKSSRKGNYESISIKEVMMSIDAVIDRYKSLGQIEGLISL